MLFLWAKGPPSVVLLQGPLSQLTCGLCPGVSVKRSGSDWNMFYTFVQRQCGVDLWLM